MTAKQKTTPPGGPDQPSDPSPWWDEFQGLNGGPSGYPPPRGFPDLSPLIALVDAMRRMVPAELQEQVNALQRELLLTIRARPSWRTSQLTRSLLLALAIGLLAAAPAQADITVSNVTAAPESTAAGAHS